MGKYKLFDAEYKFVSIIWDKEPINSTELVRFHQKFSHFGKPCSCFTHCHTFFHNLLYNAVPVQSLFAEFFLVFLVKP